MTGCFAFTSGDILLAVSGAGGTVRWTWPAVAGSTLLALTRDDTRNPSSVSRSHVSSRGGHHLR